MPLSLNSAYIFSSSASEILDFDKYFLVDFNLLFVYFLALLKAFRISLNFLNIFKISSSQKNGVINNSGTKK
tara:strand:+ start:139 stop:354 length:216 start_codon:yes stop_codon:yes gene_type:complete